MNVIKNSEILELFHKLGHMKKIKRAGMVRLGIPNAESIADHSFRVAFMAMFFGDLLNNIDTLKLIKMALIHDIPEAICGDITPLDGISSNEKKKIEETALNDLLFNIPNKDEYVDLWYEYEDGKSLEAKFLKCIDKLEMAIQADEYKQLFPDKDLTPLFIDADLHINIPEIRVIFEEVNNKF